MRQGPEDGAVELGTEGLLCDAKVLKAVVFKKELTCAQADRAYLPTLSSVMSHWSLEVGHSRGFMDVQPVYLHRALCLV